MRSKGAAIIAIVVIGILTFYLGKMSTDGQPVSNSEVVGREITELQEEIKDLRDRTEQNTRFRERLCERIQEQDDIPEQARFILNYAAQACQD